MSERRSFLASVIAGLLAILFPWQLKASPEDGLKKIYRWTGTGWKRCRLMQLQVGDVFRAFSVDPDYSWEGVACSPPSKDRSGEAGIQTVGRDLSQTPDHFPRPVNFENASHAKANPSPQIGRASCRERVYGLV